jgi:hypothetical protein
MAQVKKVFANSPPPEKGRGISRKYMIMKGLLILAYRRSPWNAAEAAHPAIIAIAIDNNP